jgi:hypothetical protein
MRGIGMTAMGHTRKNSERAKRVRSAPLKQTESGDSVSAASGQELPPATQELLAGAMIVSLVWRSNGLFHGLGAPWSSGCPMRPVMDKRG